MLPKAAHGGKRPNQSGRPSLGVTSMRVTLTPDQIEVAKKLGVDNVSAGIRAALDASVNQRYQQDAKRYQWLRDQHWSNSDVIVVKNDNNQVTLGTECPSRERLDELIDAAIAAKHPAA
jgi:post-segregation antitoxin (ccd killing protein)